MSMFSAAFFYAFFFDVTPNPFCAVSTLCPLCVNKSAGRDALLWLLDDFDFDCMPTIVTDTELCFLIDTLH